MVSPIAILFDRLGPYHVARIAAAARAYPAVAIEFGRHTPHYAWDVVDAEERFDRFTVVPDASSDDVGRLVFAKRLFRLLDAIRPATIALPGWHHHGALLALSWALRHDVPTVMMSESQAIDEPRRWWKELIKTRVLRLCSAVLVGGERHAAYARALGVPAECIFPGYDAVDNEYFSASVARVRAEAEMHRSRLRLPQRFFLSSSRFIPKKNLLRLLRAYAAFRRQSGSDAPKLVLLGDGPLKDAIVTERNKLQVEADVILPGFQQYGDLPSYYALAEAFVHASTTEQWGLVVNEAAAASLPLIVSHTCGCVPELLAEGENGFIFDPLNEAQLTAQLARMASSSVDRRAMGLKSLALVEQLSPENFANQLRSARDVAVIRPRRAHGVDRLLLDALALR